MRQSKERMLAILGLLLLLVGCAATPEEEGTCKIECSKSKVGSIDFVVEPLTPAGLTSGYSCIGEAGKSYPLSGAIKVSYRIYERLSGKASGQADDAMNTDLGERKVPRSGIAFQPNVTGLMNTAKTNPEFLTTDPPGCAAGSAGCTSVASPSYFDGIVTPKEDWCSDTCGVMTYEVWPVCAVPLNNGVVAGITVQGIQAESYTTIDIEGQELEE